MWLCEAWNDMSHFTPSHYVVSEYHYVTDDQFVKFMHFTDPTLMTPDKLDEMDLLGKALQDIMQTSFAQRMDRAIQMNPAKSQLWQYNGWSEGFKHEVRNVVCLGERHFQIWSDYDAYVRLPVLRFKRDVLNWYLRPRQDREIKEWNRWLKERHRKQSSQSSTAEST